MSVQAGRAVGRAFGSELLALTPPYRASTSLHSDEEASALPLGSVVVAMGEPPIAGLAELTRLSYRCPWAVPCMALSLMQEPFEPLLMLVTELRERLVVVSRWADLSSPQWLVHVVTSVRRRPLPGPILLAQWVVHRVHHSELEAPLHSQFEEALRGSMTTSLSVATYSRLFSHYGRYTARDWRAIARLCRHAQAGTMGGDHAAARLPLRTASRYTRRYLEVPYQVIAKRLGWEWVLEAALRTGGYV